MKRCFIYIRVSTNKQAEEGYSIPQQTERLTKYCDAMGWELAGTYIDDGYSGGSLDRPDMNRMRKDIASGKTDIVLVDKLDRLSRSQFDTLFLIQKVFDAYGVSFVSRAESFDTSSSFGKAMVGILSVFAELERSRIKERMADGKDGRAKAGYFNGGGHTPIGYDYSNNLLTINDYESVMVREAFELAAEHTPFSIIAKTLNDKGYRTKYGPFNRTTFQTLLRNPLYIGKVTRKGNVYDGQHDPIISMELWEKVQAVLAKRDVDYDKYRPGKRYAAPLGGICWCGCCGAKYHWRTNGKNQDGSLRSYYMCYSRAKSNKAMIKDPNCKNRNYRDRDLEKIVYDEIHKLISQKGYFESIQQADVDEKKRKSISKQIDKINHKISKLMDLYSLDEIDVELLREKLTPLNEERDSLQNELDNMDTSPKKSKEEVIGMVHDFEKSLAEGNCYQVHNFLTELVDYILINTDTIEIHWNF